MRASVLLLSALIALTALAGCLEDEPPRDGLSPGENDDDFNPFDDETADDDDSVDNGTTDPAENETEENRPPTGNLSADLESGDAPLTVTFSFDGSDPDGNDLNWSLDVDDDGSYEVEGDASGLPGTYNHSYDSAGSYVAVLRIDDRNITHVEKLVITVTEPSSEPPAEPESQVEDRGEYLYDPETGLCDAKSYDEVVPGTVYNSQFGGGDWYFVETNEIPGLQYENNHPLAPAGAIPVVGSWVLDLPDCMGGDQTAL